jgi:hypothetical protein
MLFNRIFFFLYYLFALSSFVDCHAKNKTNIVCANGGTRLFVSDGDLNITGASTIAGFFVDVQAEGEVNVKAVELAVNNLYGYTGFNGPSFTDMTREYSDNSILMPCIQGVTDINVTSTKNDINIRSAVVKCLGAIKLHAGGDINISYDQVHNYVREKGISFGIAGPISDGLKALQSLAQNDGEAAMGYLRHMAGGAIPCLDNITRTVESRTGQQLAFNTAKTLIEAYKFINNAMTNGLGKAMLGRAGISNGSFRPKLELSYYEKEYETAMAMCTVLAAQEVFMTAQNINLDGVQITNPNGGPLKTIDLKAQNSINITDAVNTMRSESSSTTLGFDTATKLPSVDASGSESSAIDRLGNIYNTETVKLKADKITLVNTLFNSQNTDVKADILEVIAKQSESSSEGFSFSTSPDSLHVSAHNSDAKTTPVQPGFVSEEGHIKANKTKLKGGLINFKTGTLDSKHLEFEDVHDYRNSRSFGIGASGFQSLNNTNPIARPEINGSFDLNYSRSDFRATNRATVSQGTDIKTESDISGLNRDASQSRVVTRDDASEFLFYSPLQIRGATKESRKQIMMDHIRKTCGTIDESYPESAKALRQINKDIQAAYANGTDEDAIIAAAESKVKSYNMLKAMEREFIHSLLEDLTVNNQSLGDYLAEKYPGALEDFMDIVDLSRDMAESYVVAETENGTYVDQYGNEYEVVSESNDATETKNEPIDPLYEEPTEPEPRAHNANSSEPKASPKNNKSEPQESPNTSQSNDSTNAPDTESESVSEDAVTKQRRAINHLMGVDEGQLIFETSTAEDGTKACHIGIKNGTNVPKSDAEAYIQEHGQGASESDVEPVINRLAKKFDIDPSLIGKRRDVGPKLKALQRAGRLHGKSKVVLKIVNKLSKGFRTIRFVRFLSAVTPTGAFGLAAGYGMSQGVEFVAEKAADSLDRKVHSMVSGFIDDIQESETMAKNFGDFQTGLKNARKSGKISTQDAAKLACDHGLFGLDGVGNPNAYETVEPGMDKFLSAVDNFSLKTAMAAAAAGTIRNVGGKVEKKSSGKSGVDKGSKTGQNSCVPKDQHQAKRPGNFKSKSPSSSKPLLHGEGKVGTYKKLIKLGKKGDNLTPHHMPSAAQMKENGISRDDGISMWVEQPTPGKGGRHRLTRTYGRKPKNETPRAALARDIKDMRKIYKDQNLYTRKIATSLKKVISKNKEIHKEVFKKK